jgi:hypothetical protein
MRSRCDTLKAAEILKPLRWWSRLRHTTMKLPSPSANPDKKLPSELDMTSMRGLSC